ncbi:DNA primase small subunit-like [Copidosoma floridanum]|uniref:DNA primase small subunit-like n=1 Tax=Copidosoma floridanum TaxID=29053 RepID=UPI0006C9B84E|nr:DNA primase small subunit-like [Copidosoma floridanum]
MNNTCFEDTLSVYFSRLFPYDYFHKWLSYGDEKTFSHREFAFNFEGERFLRHQAYKDINGLKQVIKKLHPVKIDIGAVFNISPLNSLREKRFYPVQRELIFDIDVTDYDDVRTCCKGVDMCSKCWNYMIVAVKILDAALREDFGFENILWVFSGRRGIHCWVCDHRARLLKRDARWGVATYLQLVTGGEFMKKKVTIGSKIHHSVKRALEVIQPVFISMCVENQDMLGTEERVLKFLGIIADDEMRAEVQDLFDEHCTSLTKWNAFIKFFKKQIESENEKWCKTPYLIEEIMLQYAYPRLDINVTLGMTHLLKAPFCVHPKTGKIGVPIDPMDIDDFDPYNIPTILELFDEIDKFDKQATEQGMTIEKLKEIEDVKKTSLEKYMCIFENFLQDLENTFKITAPNDINLESD